MTRRLKAIFAIPRDPLPHGCGRWESEVVDHPLYGFPKYWLMYQYHPRGAKAYHCRRIASSSIGVHGSPFRPVVSRNLSKNLMCNNESIHQLVSKVHVVCPLAVSFFVIALPPLIFEDTALSPVTMSSVKLVTLCMTLNKLSW